jgi:hypothetical protein
MESQPRIAEFSINRNTLQNSRSPQTNRQFDLAEWFLESNDFCVRLWTKYLAELIEHAHVTALEYRSVSRQILPTS